MLDVRMSSILDVSIQSPVFPVSAVTRSLSVSPLSQDQEKVFSQCC